MNANTVVLVSHGIDETGTMALFDGDEDKFLNLRAEYLRPHFQSFFDRHARWDEPDRPSIASLLVEDEDS